MKDAYDFFGSMFLTDEEKKQKKKIELENELKQQNGIVYSMALRDLLLEKGIINKEEILIKEKAFWNAVVDKQINFMKNSISKLTKDLDDDEKEFMTKEYKIIIEALEELRK